MKREIKLVNGTPNKRMYWSIISDYNLNTAICELIDNALDIWLKGSQNTLLKITIDVDIKRQSLLQNSLEE
jgi:DNA gyrase/topoisomerase IV subunit B